MTPAEIRALADAVEAETALDGQVALAFGWRCEEYSKQVKLTGAWHTLHVWKSPENKAFNRPPRFAASLDALAAECARREWDWGAGTHDDSVNMAWAWAGRHDMEGFSITPAAALCAALLRAVAAEKETDDD